MQISKTHTACKNCIFAEYNGRTQTGCFGGKTKEYEKQGRLVEAHDHDAEFYIINDSVCMHYRSQHWAKFDEEGQVEDLWQIAVEESAISYQVILFNMGKVDEIIARVKEFLVQKIKPAFIMVINRNVNINHIDLSYKMQKHCNVPWKVQNPAGFATDDEAFDTAMDTNNYATYYVKVSYIAPVIPECFSEELNDYISLKGNRVGLLEGIPVEICHIPMYRLFHGTRGGNIREKIIHNGDLNYIQPIEEACPCLR